MTRRGEAIDSIMSDPVKRLINLIASLVKITIDKIKRGAIFCHLIIMYRPTELSVERILGSQKCIGAAPNFITMPSKVNITIEVLMSAIMALLKITIDPTLCTIKYIMACFLLFSSFITLGTNLIKFNSKPNQIRGQELKEITANDPTIMPNIIYFNENKVYYL